MKAVSDHFSAPFSSNGISPDGGFDTSFLGKIGDDLRHLYGEMTESDLPRSLLDLAETIDARRLDEMRDG